MSVKHIEPSAVVCNANDGQCPWQTRCKDECRVKPEADFMSPVKRLMPVGPIGSGGVAIVDPDTGAAFGTVAEIDEMAEFHRELEAALAPDSRRDELGLVPWENHVDGSVLRSTAAGPLPPPKDGKGYVLREAPSKHRQPPTLLPVDSQARKDIPLFDFLRGYFPRAFIELARFSKVSCDKHNPGEPMHWSKGKSTDHLNCVGRHLLEVGDKDEFGFWHDVALFWRAGANLEIRLEAEAMGVSYEELIKQYEEMERT